MTSALMPGRVRFAYASPALTVRGTGLFAEVREGFIFFTEARFHDGTEAARVGVPVTNLVDVRSIETSARSAGDSDTSVVLDVGADQPAPGSLIRDFEDDEWELDAGGRWINQETQLSAEWPDLLATRGPVELLRDGKGR